MADTTVKQRYIGSSFKFQVILPDDFASYTEITANIISVNSDRQIISKNKKTPTAGYKTLLVDPTNTKAFWVYIESSESLKAFETVYNCQLILVVPDNTYPSGSRNVEKSIQIVKFVAL